MIEVSETILILSVFVLILVQAVGMQFAAHAGSPRGYYIMSTLLGLILMYLTMVLGPQVI
jgi:hypothetical protein